MSLLFLFLAGPPPPKNPAFFFYNFTPFPSVCESVWSATFFFHFRFGQIDTLGVCPIFFGFVSYVSTHTFAYLGVCIHTEEDKKKKNSLSRLNDTHIHLATEVRIGRDLGTRILTSLWQSTLILGPDRRDGDIERGCCRYGEAGRLSKRRKRN